MKKTTLVKILILIMLVRKSLQILENGQPSDRYKELETLCSGTEINIFSAYKTLEYALCCSENNIYHMVEAIKNCYVDLGPKLEERLQQKRTKIIFK